MDAEARTRLDGAIGNRPLKKIGVHAVRGGDIAGEDTILSAGHSGPIELVHRDSSRDIFARSAIKAAGLVAHKPPQLYSMSEVLS